MLETSGFEVLDIQSIWHDYILSATVQKRSASNISAFAEKRKGIQKALHQFADKHQDGGVAVWGAGHQALATLALLNLGEKLNMWLILHLLSRVNSRLPPICPSYRLRHSFSNL